MTTGQPDITAREAGALRWAGVPAEERSAAGRHAARARWDAREASGQMPQKARPATAAKAAHARWTPEARAASAIRTLVEQAPPLSTEQVDRLRALLAPYIVRVERDRADG